MFVDREQRRFCKTEMDFGGLKIIISDLFSFSWRRFWDIQQLINDENSLLPWFLWGHKFACHQHNTGTAFCYVLYVCMYTQNNSVPRMEPWGTPQVRGSTEDGASPESSV